MKRPDIDRLERKARHDATKLDGTNGDPARYGNWIGHRDHARSVVDLVAYIRELESELAYAATICETTGHALASSKHWRMLLDGASKP